MDLTKLLRVMKLTAFILLAACLQVSATGAAQGITLKAKDMPLEKVFAEIKSQTGYVVFYEYSVIKESRSVTLNVTNASVVQFLNECFKDQSLDYTIEGKTILVTKKNTNKIAEAVTTASPPISIKGRIVNESGEPVAATILVKGTNKGTGTRPNGDFDLNEVDENATLVITGVSIETMEIKLDGRSDLGTITVKAKVTGLGEVVINKGYYSEKQKFSTGNVGRVTSKELERQPVLNPLAAMQGRVAGMEITQETGIPGGGFTVKIRGTNSISSGNSPLYILDGVPFNGDMNGVSATASTIFGAAGKISTLNYINPQDIESVEVLKDADATAIYGSRGANGVVLITTKKAKAGKMTTGFNISQGIGQVGNFMKLMNKEQYMQMRTLAFKTANLTPTATDYDMNGAWNNNPEINWPQKILGGNAQYTDAQLSFSGGSGLTNFLVNGSWHKETTVHPMHFPYDRKSVFVSINSSSPDRRFNIQVSGNYSSSTQRMPYTDLMESAYAYPNAPEPFKEDGSLNWDTDWQNPYARLEIKNLVTTNNLFGSAALNYKIWKGITAKVTASFNQLQFNDNQQFAHTWFRPILGNTTSRSTFTFNNTNTWNVEPQLNYETKLGNGTFAALAGATLQENIGNFNSVTGAGYTDINLLGSLAAAATLEKGTYRKTEYRYRGLYMRLNYNWLEKYVVNLTARTDGSSRFAPDYRFRNFGSVAAAWLFSNEKFFKKALPFISYGKLRASYGLIGNDQFADYRYLDLYNYTSYAVLYQATQGLLPGNLYNPDLQWEKTRKLEIGLEMGMLRDRINVTASWYRNRSGNQIIDFPIPATTGFTSVAINLDAEVENSGWEFTFNSLNIDNRNFKWRTTFNLAHQQNKLLSFPGKKRSATFDRYEIGKPITSGLYFKYAGVDPLTGLYTFYTSNGVITFAPNSVTDRAHVIDKSPTIIGGFGNNFTWKGFELDFLFTFAKKKGNNPLFYNNQVHGMFSRTNYYNVMPEVLNAWQKPGDITNIQRLSPVTAAEANTYASVILSDYNIVDASYVKLKNISLAWQFTPQLRKTLHLQSGKVYVQCQNLFTITSFKGWDPEPTLSGDAPPMPPLRVITAGIQITF
jgi:TonB-dependent starch-binding outer membrane protein SusC